MCREATKALTNYCLTEIKQAISRTLTEWKTGISSTLCIIRPWHYLVEIRKQTQVIQLLSRSRPNHMVQMQAAHWSKRDRTISRSVDKGDTEFVSPECVLLLFAMGQATERYNKI